MWAFDLGSAHCRYLADSVTTTPTDTPTWLTVTGSPGKRSPGPVQPDRYLAATCLPRSVCHSAVTVKRSHPGGA